MSICMFTFAVCVYVSIFKLFPCIDSVYKVVDISEFINCSFAEAAASQLVISSSVETLCTLHLPADLRCSSKQKTVFRGSEPAEGAVACFSLEPVQLMRSQH